jgi:hypothetical protein
MARVSIQERSCKVTRKRVYEFVPLCTCRALLAKANNLSNSFVGLKGHRCSEHVGTGLLRKPSKAQEDGRMYRVSRAQHPIPEQQHHVCDDDAAQGSWVREHAF